MWAITNPGCFGDGRIEKKDKWQRWGTHLGRAHSPTAINSLASTSWIHPSTLNPINTV